MTPTHNIMIVDDDRELTSMLAEFFSHERLELVVAASAEAATALLNSARPGLLILDVMLPGRSGLEILREVRLMMPDLPVLMLTARGDETDRILGLELGADDYLAKPFNPRELLARVRAILRRAGPAGADTRVLRLGNIELNPATRAVAVAGRAIILTGAEFGVLVELLGAAGTVVSRADLTERALGRPLELYDRSVDTHVSNLRRKLVGSQLDIRSVRGAGYVATATTTA